MSNVEFTWVCVLCFLILALIFHLVFLSWTVHLSITSTQQGLKGKGNYKKFLQQYNKYGQDNWFYYERWGGSLFAEKPEIGELGFMDKMKIHNNYQLHADLLKFDGKYMKIINPIDYVRIKRFIKKEIKRKSLNTDSKIESVKW